MAEERPKGRVASPTSLLLWLLLPLLIGIGISLLIPQPVIGVIVLSDAIFFPTAEDLITQIEYAYEAPEVRAVVLVLDSPGGTVTDTEAVYLELARLRTRKPVVTMVHGLAASGAYYLAVGTDEIVAGPSAPIGNVGVITQLPPRPELLEDIVSTGPYKLWGAPRDVLLRRMEVIKQGFFQAVALGRGDRLQIDAEILLRGEIWPAGMALEMGLIDELGSRTRAIERAAELARVAHYQVADLRVLAGIPDDPVVPFFQTTEDGLQTPYPRLPGLYLLYIPPFEGVPAAEGGAP